MLAAAFTHGAPAAAGRAETTVSGTVRSGAEIDYPPFSFVDEHGRATGFSVELMREALAAMGRDVSFRTGPWPEVRGWLERADIDALPLVGRTPEREALFDFTVPYMSLHGAIVVRGTETGIRDLDDLRGRTVGVMKGDNAEEFLRREDRGIEIITDPTFEIALTKLSKGRYDAVVVQRLVALRLIRKTGLTDLRVIGRPIEGFKQDFCFAVHEGDRDTLALLNEGLAIVTADGTYRRLHSEWFAAMQLPSDRPIIVGGDRNFPPYEFLDKNGYPTGYNVDLTRAIAREMGLNIEIRLGRWTERLQALETGEIDVLQGMFYSPGRGRTYDFTPPHTVSRYVAVVRKGTGPAPESVADLKGKRIIVEENDILHDIAVENGLEAQITAVADQEAALRGLIEGRYDCALVSHITLHYLAAGHGWPDLVHGKKPVLAAEYCYAARKGRKALLTQFGEGLKALENSGEYRKIHDKWLGVYRETSISFITALKVSAAVIIPLLVIALLTVVWSWSLRRQVAEKTRALQESLDRFKYVFEASNAGKSIILPTGEMNVNRAFADFLGYTQEELAGKRWQDLTPVRDLGRTEQIVNSLLAGEKDADRFEKRYVHKSGKHLWADVSIAVRRGAEGKPVYFMTTIVDITEQKRAAARIDHLNQVLRTVRDINQLIVREREKETLIREGCRLLVAHRGYLSAMIVLTDDNNRPFAWATEGLAADSDPLTGILASGALPSCCEQARDGRGMLVVEDRQAVCAACPVAEACAERQPLCAPLIYGNQTFGYVAVAAEKELFVGEEEKSLFAEMAGDFAYAVHVMKIEEARKQGAAENEKLQAQLLQSQKMESVGRLAGGVAHDFNNMLSVIIGYAEFVIMQTDPGEGVYHDLQEILKAARRSADITRHLLAFARKQTIHPKVIDLNDTVEGMLKMLRRLIGEDIDLSWEPGSGLWRVKIDPSQLDQILANLCVNARDAIADVGKITIETGNVRFDEKYCADHIGFVPGEYVLLAVSDDGCGMARDMQDKIFEPFFTTKGTGKGTGLGLSTIYGILKQNDGFINVYSEPGKGTTFRLYFPRYSDAAVQIDTGEAEEIPLGSGETILVVEDETAILNLAQRILASCGYRVLKASGHEEAVACVKARPGEIDLLITDVVLPGMNGRDLADRLTTDSPKMRVIYMSGYTANVIAHHGVLDPGVHFIQKPFSNRDIAVKVAEVLNGGKSG